MVKYYFLLSTLFLFACQERSECFSSWKKSSVKQADLEVFNSITLPDYLDVYWKQSTEYKIEITGSEKLIPYLTWELAGDTLNISYQSKCEWLRNHRNRIAVTITSPQLEYVEMVGSSTFESIDTITNNFTFSTFINYEDHKILVKNDASYFKINGGASVLNISGTTHFTYFYSFGFGQINAKSLFSPHAYIDNASLSTTEIYSDSLLEIKQQKSGTINYYGNPDSIRILHQSGEGPIINR